MNPLVAVHRPDPDQAKKAVPPGGRLRRDPLEQWTVPQGWWPHDAPLEVSRVAELKAKRSIQLLFEQLTDGRYLAESDCDGKHCLPVLLFEDDDALFSCFLRSD